MFVCVRDCPFTGKSARALSAHQKKCQAHQRDVVHSAMIRKSVAERSKQRKIIAQQRRNHPIETVLKSLSFVSGSNLHKIIRTLQTTQYQMRIHCWMPVHRLVTPQAGGFHHHACLQLVLGLCYRLVLLLHLHLRPMNWKCQVVGPKGNAGYPHVIGIACQSQPLFYHSTKINHCLKFFHVSALSSGTQCRLWQIYSACGGSTLFGRHMIQTTLSLLTRLPLHRTMTMYPKTLVEVNQMRKTPFRHQSQSHRSTFCFIGKIRVAAQNPMLKWTVSLIFCIIPISQLMIFQRISVRLVKIANEINRRRSLLISRASRR